MPMAESDETLEPNAATQPAPYDHDDGMKLANEHRWGTPQSHQAQPPRDGAEIYFEARVGAFG